MRESDHCGDTGSRFINTHIETDSAFRFPPDPPLQCWRARVGGEPERAIGLDMGVYKSRPGIPWESMCTLM